MMKPSKQSVEAAFGKDYSENNISYDYSLAVKLLATVLSIGGIFLLRFL